MRTLGHTLVLFLGITLAIVPVAGSAFQPPASAAPTPAVVSVPIDRFVNANLRDAAACATHPGCGYTGGNNYPVAPTILNIAGIAFKLVPFRATPGSLGVLQTPAGTSSFDIPAHVFGATTVSVLMNSVFGASGSDVGSLEFRGTGGADATFQIIEGTNIRDHFSDGFNNACTDCKGAATFGPDRLDMQTFQLPTSFATNTLTDIIFRGSGGKPQGQPFLAAVTVGTAKTTVTVNGPPPASGPAPVPPTSSLTPVTPTPPMVQFAAPELQGLTVTLDGVIQPTIVGATVTQLQWTWGDGTQTVGWFPQSHTYGRPGTYKVTVTAVDSNGLRGTATSTVAVSGGPTPGSLVVLSYSIAPTSSTVFLGLPCFSTNSSNNCQTIDYPASSPIMAWPVTVQLTVKNQSAQDLAVSSVLKNELTMPTVDSSGTVPSVVSRLVGSTPGLGGGPIPTGATVTLTYLVTANWIFFAHPNDSADTLITVAKQSGDTIVDNLQTAGKISTAKGVGATLLIDGLLNSWSALRSVLTPYVTYCLALPAAGNYTVGYAAAISHTEGANSQVSCPSGFPLTVEAQPQQFDLFLAYTTVAFERAVLPNGYLENYLFNLFNLNNNCASYSCEILHAIVQAYPNSDDQLRWLSQRVNTPLAPGAASTGTPFSSL